MGEEIVVEDRGPLRWIIVDRYERRNAWTLEMARYLGEVMAESRNDDAVGGLVFAGKSGCFSAGIDRSVLGQDLQASPFEVESFLRYEKPTLACIDGLAYGMGTTMALGCDLRVGSTNATFTMGFGSLGRTPEWGVSYLLWRQIGWSRAIDLLLTDRTVSASEALHIGMIDRLVAPHEVESVTQSLGERIVNLPNNAAREIKAVMWRSLEANQLNDARSFELDAIFSRATQDKHEDS